MKKNTARIVITKDEFLTLLEIFLKSRYGSSADSLAYQPVDCEAIEKKFVSVLKKSGWSEYGLKVIAALRNGMRPPPCEVIGPFAMYSIGIAPQRSLDNPPRDR